jgi:hypothetical protein
MKTNLLLIQIRIRIGPGFIGVPGSGSRFKRAKLEKQLTNFMFSISGRSLFRLKASPEALTSFMEA